MTVEELIIYGKKYVHSHEAKIFLATILGYDTLELLNHLDESVAVDKVNKYKKFIEDFINNKPLQYIVGNVNFYGYDFDINENVLIPRFDTEQLVYHVINFIDNHFNGRGELIDLGCGSGVIGITLAKKFPNLKVTCLDISQEALDVTRKNALKLGVDLEIRKGNILEGFDGKFDIIVSNPPYIALNEEIDDIVRDNEPHLALYGGEDGLDYYRAILRRASLNIKDKFLIAFEIGATQKDSIISLAKEHLNGASVQCFKDLSGRDRVIFIYNA